MTQHKEVICYVALGSNLGDSASYLMRGLKALTEHPEISFIKKALLYQSKPHGPQDQPDYINSAVVFKTFLKPEALLDELQKIENENGRSREGIERWGARTLDLDLLFYGNKSINTKRLTVPHPRICERAFVLYPLRDLLFNKEEGVFEGLSVNYVATLKECIATLPQTEKDNIQEYQTNG